MKRIIWVIFCALIFCCLGLSQLFSNEFQEEVQIEFINSTDINVLVNISEQVTQKPYTYMLLKKIDVEPGQTLVVPITLIDGFKQERVLSIQTVCENCISYGCSFAVDAYNPSIYQVELTSHWHHVGEEFWPQLDPMRYIKPRLVNYSIS